MRRTEDRDAAATGEDDSGPTDALEGSPAPARNDEDPVDPLSVLGNAVRVRVLRALADADGALAFSELRRRSDVRDTGRFNYHLDRLTDYFVDEVDDGYVLAPEGSRVVDLADATGIRSDGDATDAVVAASDDGECPVCGDEDCDRLYHVHLDPPGR